MRSFLFLLPLFAMFYLSCGSDSSKKLESNKKFVYVDFDEAIGAQRIGKNYFQDRKVDEKRYKEFARIWQAEAAKVNLTAKEMAQLTPKIPKIIHQVWLDSEPLPKNFKKYTNSWQEKHPDWQYRLWTARDLAEFSKDVQLALGNAKEVYEKENIVRAAVLEKFGGLSVDFEFECLKAVDELNFRYDFYTALEPPLLKPQFGRVLQVGTCFMAAAPNHPIIKRWMEEMKVRIKKGAGQFENAREKKLWSTYTAFNDVLDEMLDDDQRSNVVLPPTYAYPINPRWIYSFNKTEYLKNRNKKKKGVDKKVKKILDKQTCPLFSIIQPESFALNHIGGSWGKDRARFKALKSVLSQADIQEQVNNNF